MKQNINQKWEMICKYMNEFEIEYHKLASYYNLSDSSFWILYELYENKEGCTQKELYTEWCLNKQTINSSVKYLTKEGYIALENFDNSKKFKKLKLTEEGMKLAKNTIGKVIKLEERAFENINENEMDIVINFFKKQTISFKNEVRNAINEGENEE